MTPFTLSIHHSGSGSSPSYHGINGKVPSAVEVDLKSVEEVEGVENSDTLYRVHGSFMILAWLSSASCGLILAR